MVLNKNENTVAVNFTNCLSYWLSTSVTRLGDFWKFLATKFLAKEAQMIGNFLGYFEKPHSYAKTALATFGKNCAIFYSNIWSHCYQLKPVFRWMWNVPPLTLVTSLLLRNSMQSKVKVTHTRACLLELLWKFQMNGHIISPALRRSFELTFILQKFA